MREIDPLEIDVIEAAIDLWNWRQASHYGPGEMQRLKAEKHLDRCVEALLADNDGQWSAPS